MSSFSSKDPAENIVVTLGFAAVLAGETISGLPTVVASVDSGVDSTPSAILSGAPQVSGGDVLQRIAGGINQVTYKLLFTLTTSTGRILNASRLLPVRTR